MLDDEPDDLYILREDFNRGIKLLKDFDLRYDLLIFERHLPQTIQFVDRHPTQIFILDHIAKPRIREGMISPWRENLTELARRENVFCKLSGLVTEANWQSWTVPLRAGSIRCGGVSLTCPNTSKREYWARPPRKLIGYERDDIASCGPRFFDRYTISVIGKCEAYEAN